MNFICGQWFFSDPGGDSRFCAYYVGPEALNITGWWTSRVRHHTNLVFRYWRPGDHKIIQTVDVHDVDVWHDPGRNSDRSFHKDGKSLPGHPQTLLSRWIEIQLVFPECFVLLMPHTNMMHNQPGLDLVKQPGIPLQGLRPGRGNRHPHDMRFLSRVQVVC